MDGWENAALYLCLPFAGMEPSAKFNPLTFKYKVLNVINSFVYTSDIK